MLRLRAIAAALVLGSSGLAGQTPASNGSPQPARHTTASHALPSPTVVAGRRTSDITLDGRLDEPAWSAVQPATDFRQAQPKPGEPATQRTEIRLLFDEDAIYIGARMFDDQGAAGVRTQLVRRDESPSSSDQIEFVLDT